MSQGIQIGADFSTYLNTVSTYGGETVDAKRKRFVGIYPASAADTAIYDGFIRRVNAAYPATASRVGSENYYDAAYMLAYAIVAAGFPAKLDGSAIALGMNSITKSGAAQIKIGPNEIGTAFQTLQGGGQALFDGALGLSTFNPGTGSRFDPGAAACLTYDASATPQVSLKYDVETPTSATPPTFAQPLNCFPGL
jgi:hypothetical protein